MEIMISRALRDEIVAFAAAEPEREVCGLLFGSITHIVAARPCLNVSPTPADSFEIEPAALIAAHKSMRAGGPTVIGCYHSHPNGMAEPSAMDIANADVAFPLWLIVAQGTTSVWCYEGHNSFRIAAIS